MTRHLSVKISKVWLEKFLIFIFFFYLNIGVKEVYLLLEGYDFVILSNSIFIAIAITAFILSRYFISKSFQVVFFIALLFYFYLVITALYGELNYGLFKAYNGLLLPFTIATFFGIFKWEEEDVLQFLILSIFIISLYAIFYKLKTDFFNRNVLYGLFGSITFGWMASIGFLAALFQDQNKKYRKFFIVFFLIMLIWSGSKGPFFGVVITLLIYFRKFIKQKISVKNLFIILGVPLFIFIIYTLEIRQLSFINKILEDPKTYLSGEGSGSIGVRIKFFDYAITQFLESPMLGKGFGSFMNNDFTIHKYPHNIYLEILSETGLIGFLFFFLVIFLLRTRNRLSYIGLFGLIVLFFSGDFSYLRYAIYLLLISYVVLRE